MVAQCRACHFYYSDFTGGLNTRDQAYLLTDNQGRDIQNIQGTEAGALVKRGGLVTTAATSGVFNSLFAAESTPSNYLVGASGTNLYSVNAAGLVSSIHTGVTAGAHWEWRSTEPVTVPGTYGPIYGMNGVDAPQTWTGATASTPTVNWTASVGTVPNGKYMILAGNRLWVAGVAGTPNRVYFSDIIPVNNGPVSWPVANVDMFDENDGQQITGMGMVGAYVLVFKPRKTYVIYNLNTGDARMLSNTIGAVSHRSVAQGVEGTYFLSEDRGVYLTTGSKIEPVSDLIQPTFDSIEPGQRANSAGVYLNGHYYLSINRAGAAGQNDTCVDWDENLKSWWLHTFGSNQMCVWHSNPAANPMVYSAKGTAAIVDQCFMPGVYTDNGLPVTWVWRGPWQSPTFYHRRRIPTPYFKKRLRQVRVEGSGTVDVSMATDFYGAEVLKQPNVFGQMSVDTWGNSLTNWGGPGIWGSSPTASRAKLFSFGVANAFSQVFSATSSTADTVTGYMWDIGDRKDLLV